MATATELVPTVTAEQLSPAPRAAAGGSPRHQWHALIVRDEKDERRDLASMLESCGYHPVNASSVNEATAQFLRRRIDIIILDSLTSGMTCLEFYKVLFQEFGCGFRCHVRSTGRLPPIIVVTTCAGAIDGRKQGLSTDVVAILVKPVDRNTMCAVVKSAVRRLKSPCERCVAGADSATPGRRRRVSSACREWRRHTVPSWSERAAGR